MFWEQFNDRYTTIPYAVYRSDGTSDGRKVISHHHREAEIIAMTDGAADFYLDGEHFRIESGDILLIPPYSVHRAEVPDGHIGKYNYICFDTKILWDEELKNGLLDNSISVTHVIKRESEPSEKIQKLIETGCCACESGEKGWELLAIGAMSQIFGILKRNECFKSNLNTKTTNVFAKEAMKYISENYSSQISSTNAAAAFYMNNSYFCRCFKKIFGCCFSDYLLSFRLEKAKIYLSDTADSVTDVAFRTGFCGCSYFCKMFKKKFGVSPLAYRKIKRDTILLSN